MKLIMCHSKKFPGIHCPGRFVMTCCENDIQFVGIVAKGDSLKAYKNRDWVDITATVKKSTSTPTRARAPYCTSSASPPRRSPRRKSCRSDDAICGGKVNQQRCGVFSC